MCAKGSVLEYLEHSKTRPLYQSVSETSVSIQFFFENYSRHGWKLAPQKDLACPQSGLVWNLLNFHGVVMTCAGKIFYGCSKQTLSQLMSFHTHSELQSWRNIFGLHGECFQKPQDT